MVDFGFNGTKLLNLKVKFNPTGDVTIVTPCEIHLAGENDYLDVHADRVCAYGRKGVTVAVDAGNPDMGIVAESILLASEEGDARFAKGLELVANDITIQALREAAIGNACNVQASGTVSLFSTGELSASDTVIQANTTVSAHDLILAGSHQNTIGANTVVTLGGELQIHSTGSYTGSEASIIDHAVVSAQTATVTSGRKVRLGNDIHLTVAGNLHVQADINCSVAADATIEAGSTTGNCPE
jgi:hypothetical protein